MLDIDQSVLSLHTLHSLIILQDKHYIYIYFISCTFVFEMFKCGKCVCTFTRKDSLSRHEKSHNRHRIMCDAYNTMFIRKDNLTRHMKNAHGM